MGEEEEEEDDDEEEEEEEREQQDRNQNGEWGMGAAGVDARDTVVVRGNGDPGSGGAGG